tara:strand:+ start:125 stop:346 length:222 start_codon:yes stop_codon:yes gene_type:complete
MSYNKGAKSTNDDGLAPIHHLAVIQRLGDMAALDRRTPGQNRNCKCDQYLSGFKILVGGKDTKSSVTDDESWR